MKGAIYTKMNKQDIYNLLKQKNIPHEITEHGAVYNMEEVAMADLPYTESMAKNLFVRDDKKQNFYLITVKGEKRVDLKQFRKDHNTRSLQFVSAELLMDIMGLIPGAVTPMGLLNDSECKVRWFLDKAFKSEPEIIGVHPNDNSATVWLKPDDLVELIKEHGNSVEWIEV